MAWPRSPRRRRRRRHRHRAHRLRRLGRMPWLALAHLSSSPAVPATQRWPSPTGGGGAVNAIEKMPAGAGGDPPAARRVARPPRQAAPAPVRGDMVPALISGGESVVTYPSSCTLESERMYLPAERQHRRLGHAGRDSRSREFVLPPTQSRRPIPAGRGPAGQSSGVSTSRPSRSTRWHPIVTTMLDASDAQAGPSRAVRARLVVRCSELHAVRRYAVDRGRPARHGPGRARSTSTCRSTTLCMALLGWRIAAVRYCGVALGVREVVTTKKHFTGLCRPGSRAPSAIAKFCCARFSATRAREVESA